VNTRIQHLEQQLDNFDAAERREALAELWSLAQRGDISFSKAPAVNLHTHTFYSYNAYGYSPTKFAWLARKAGLLAAGIVDFDVLDGLEEFLEAGRLLGLKTCASLESRVFVPEFASRVINSPGEPGISYHMGVGFPYAVEHPFLNKMRERAVARNRELVGRVNRFTAPVTVDYDRDVLPLTPKGNATERHICEAYAKKGDREFWLRKLGQCPAEPAALQALIRAKTMKQGGPGYVQPDKGSFPRMADINRFVLESGAIPTVTWLDGTSEGERAIDELLDVATSTGVAAINIIPDRNFTPGEKTQKLENLQLIIATAARRHLPIIVGTEMNAPGCKFVDDFTADELAPFWPHFLNGAFIAYAHTVLQRRCRMGYLSRWARDRFPDTKAKNEFFVLLGARLEPAREDLLRDVTDECTPSEILNLMKS